MLDLRSIGARIRAFFVGPFDRPAPYVVRLPEPPPPVVPAKVVAAVGASLGATVGDITGGRRHRGAVRARHAAAFALRRLGLSYPEIAVAVRWEDHSTAIAAVRGAEQRMAEPRFAAAVEAGVAAGRGAR